MTLIHTFVFLIGYLSCQNNTFTLSSYDRNGAGCELQYICLFCNIYGKICTGPRVGGEGRKGMILWFHQLKAAL